MRPLVFREIDTRPEVYNSRAVNRAAGLFLAFAALVMLVACANVANLRLVRAGARQGEIALRLAVGATRRQLVQQLLMEAAVLALGAGGVGLLVGYGAAQDVSSVRPPGNLPIVLEVTTDLRVALYTLAMSLAAAAAFGVIPALRASHPDLVPMLNGGARSTSGGHGRGLTLANALVVTQVAVSLVLLVTAGLFARSVSGAKAIHPGLEISQRTLISFNPSLLRHDPQRAAGFYRTLLDRVSRLPGVEHAALASWAPLGLQADEAGLVIQGAETRSGNEKIRAFANVVTPGYFEALGLRVTQGRRITDQDTDSAPGVAVVNETLARLAWPGQDPIGRYLRPDRDGGSWLAVVGVVADGKYRTLTESPQPYLLRPLAQQPRNSMTLVVKTNRDDASAQAAIRREVQALDPDMPLLDLKTMAQQMAKPLFVPRALTALARPAALLALVIASVGLYGVIAYSVSRRTREIGIRVAIGAAPNSVAGQVMTQGLKLAGTGLGFGTLAAFATGRLMRGVLVGVAPADPLVFAGALALLIALAGMASYVPARRASRVDPMAALRQE